MSREELMQMYRTHFGSIFFKMSIAGLVLMFLITVAPIVPVFLVWFLMIIIGMASLFILFFNEGYRNFFNQLTDVLNGLGFETLAPVIIGLGVVSVVSSVLSIAFAASSKGNVRKDRIIGSVVVLCLTVIAFIVIFAIRGAIQ